MRYFCVFKHEKNVQGRQTLLNKIVWAFMVAVFFFAATPHDFIHNEIVSHKDTIDGHHKHAGVSKVHVHCEFLQVSLSPSLPGQQPILHFHTSAYNLCFSEQTLAAPHQAVPHFFLRGPPAFC